MTDRNEIKAKIVTYIKKHDRCPNYETVGTDYYEGKEIFAELERDGIIAWVNRVSPKGRNMRRIEICKKEA